MSEEKTERKPNGPKYAMPLDYFKAFPDMVNEYWEKILPIDEYILPDFPIDCLPYPLKDYAAAVAESTQTCPDMAAMSALCVVSCCVQNKFNIHLKDGWTEPINLYGLIISPPSTGKSPVFRPLTAPVREYEKRQVEAQREVINAKYAEKRLLQAKVENLVKQAAKSTMKEAEYKQLQAELNNFTIELVPKYVVDDVTPEKLITIMNDNGGYAAVMSPEGTIFDIIAGRYTGGAANIDAFLKAYSGDSIRVNRRDREEYIYHPRLTMLISTQPEAFDDIQGNKAFLGKGLLSRILYCTPKIRTEQKFYTDPIPKSLKDDYCAMCNRLLELPTVQGQFELITLSKEAAEIFSELYLKMSRMKVSELDFMADWAGKYCGNVARIAALIYIAQEEVFSVKQPMPEEVMQNAVKIGDYFLSHAKKAYSKIGADKTQALAAHIIEKLKMKKQYEVTRNDIYHICRCRVKGHKELTEPIKLLCDFGYLREQKIDPGHAEHIKEYKSRGIDLLTPEGEFEVIGRKGRKPSPKYACNPVFFGLFE